MGVYDDFAEAMKIFSKYGDSQGIYARHEEILAGPSPRLVSTKDNVALGNLGWFELPLEDCFSRYT